ncbi:hypothetical protein FRB90_008121 [Tulasnella sp. 427]|nr:hypothetical protein FRB90_008121 [Tulasnella sp. 427]
MLADMEAKHTRARGDAVDETYEKLQRFQIDRRRIVFALNSSKRSGGYGVVRQADLYPSSYLPTWFASRYVPPQRVAVKEIRISEVEDLANTKRAFIKELLVWSSLEDHPGIAKFIGFYAKFTRSEAWLLSPWEGYGNISEFIGKRELEVPEKLSLVHDTIEALKFLHERNPPVCHGDIKSANVLVNGNFRAVLCDFGLARLYEDSGFGRLETTTGFKGSIRWCSPEILDGAPRTPGSDIYAWAWLVWEIMTGELPYEGTFAEYSIIRKIFESPLPQVDGESRLGDCLQVWELMTRCWAAEPEDRPTANMCRTTVAYLPRCPPTSQDSTDHVQSAQLLENLGDLESWKGHYNEGLSHLETALRLYEQDGNSKGVASVLKKQAAVYYRHSYHLKALSVCINALEKYRALDDQLGTGEILLIMGSCLAIQDKREEALPFLKEALASFRARGNDVGRVQCLERIGEICRRQDQYEEASSTLANAIDIARRCGDKLGEVKSTICLGIVESVWVDVAQGTSTLSSACNMARKIGWDYGTASSLIHMGINETLENRFSGAEELYRESIVVSRRSKAWWKLAQGLSSLGRCLRRLDRNEEAAEAFDESNSVYHEISLVTHDSAQIACDLAAIKREQGKSDESLIWYDRAITQFRDLQDARWLSYCYEEKGYVLEAIQLHDEAALFYEAALVMSSQETTMHDQYDRRLVTSLASLPKTLMNDSNGDYPNWQPPASSSRYSPSSNETYEKLQRFQIDRRRIVFALNGSKRSGGYGVVRQADLYPSSYLPTWFASRYKQPQRVAVKAIRISAVDDLDNAKRAFIKELLVWSSLEDHPGIAKFIGFYAEFESSEAWFFSPWEGHGNVSEFIGKWELEVPEKLSLLLENLGDLESWKGRYTEGLSHLEKALRLYEQERDSKGVASVLKKQAGVYYRHSYHLKALSVCINALEKYRALDDQLGMEEILLIMGSCFAIQDKSEEALCFLREALASFRARGNDVGRVQCLERIGEIYRRQAKNQEAFSTLTHAIEIARRCGDKLGEAKATICLGIVERDRVGRAQGAYTLSRGCDMARKIGWDWGTASSLIDIGYMEEMEGRIPEAEKLYRESIVLSRRSKAWWKLAQGLYCLGLCLGRLDRSDEAAEAYEEAYSMYHEISLATSDPAAVASELASIKWVQGKFDESLIWYNRAITKYRSLQDAKQLSGCYEGKGGVLTTIERYDEAALLFEAALVLDPQETRFLRHRLITQLASLPKTLMKWERPKRPQSPYPISAISPLLCDVKRLQRRLPQLATASLKLPIQL